MIVPMKRLTLVALKEEEERIMQALQSLSAVHIIEAEQPGQGDSSLVHAEDTVQKLNNALHILKPYAKSPGMMTAKPEATIHELLEKVDNALTVGNELETVDRKKAALRAQIDKNQNQILLLRPWSSLSTKLNEVRAGKNTALFVGMLNTEERERLQELPENTAVQCFGGEKETAVLVLCLKEEQAEIAAFIKNLSWADVNLPPLPMTASEAIQEAEDNIKILQAEQEVLEQELLGLGQHRALIAGASDAATTERDRAQAKGLLLCTADTFVLDGWARSDEQEKIKAAINEITDAVYLEFRDPAEDEIPPSVLQNNKFTEPYEAVTKLYSLPAQGSIDGTPFMAPWYFLLFGMMLGDTGYGLVLLIGCLFFLKFVKPTGMTGSITRVLAWGSVSTIIWGPLIGTFFGMDWDAFIPAAKGILPLIVNPGSDPITMLILCFGLGLLHVFFGVGVKIYMSLRDGDWQTALFDNVSWLLIISGLLLFAILPAASTVGLIMAVVGAGMVLLFNGRGKKPVSRAVSGLAALYNISSWLTDILSYARLFALGIATGVIGSVFNQLVGMIMSAGNHIILKILFTIIGVALLIALHLFNIGINTLGTFIHCARLQFVEFYGKFYEPSGSPFKPLSYQTRHTRVIKP